MKVYVCTVTIVRRFCRLFESLQTDFGWNHVSVLLSTLVLCILFSMVFYHWYQSRNRKCTKIVLELTTGGECILVPVLHLPLCPSFWHIKPPTDIFNVRIESSHFSHKLCLDWPGFEIANVSNTNTVGVKCSFPLSWYQKYVISKILQQPFDIHILVVHHEMYYPLPHDKSTEWYSLMHCTLGQSTLIRHPTKLSRWYHMNFCFNKNAHQMNVYKRTFAHHRLALQKTHAAAEVTLLHFQQCIYMYIQW